MSTQLTDPREFSLECWAVSIRPPLVLGRFSPPPPPPPHTHTHTLPNMRLPCHTSQVLSVRCHQELCDDIVDEYGSAIVSAIEKKESWANVRNRVCGKLSGFCKADQLKDEL